jgi:uncharacterized protein YuzE
MEITHDASADALYIKLKGGKIHKTLRKGNSLIDLDKNGKTIGIEIINYSKAVPAKSERSSIVIGQKRVLLPA